jgi:anti-sigma B factor antagonist
VTIHERSVGEITVIDIDGRMTIEEGADMFREATRRLIGLGRWRLVLNLRNTPYIDSTALGEIVHAYTTVTRKGGSLKLLHVPERVYRLLAITKLVRVFEVFEAETDAVQSFTTGGPR